jgi:asparagine synthase (glutamine-hydrolysing)
MVDDVLPNGELVRRGYVNPSHIRSLIDDDRLGHQDYSKEIWHLLTLDYWLRGQKPTAAMPAEPTRLASTPSPQH